MGNYLVSAIITTYNRAPSIVLRAVNSVLNQTYKKIEIIVVDDSTNDYSERDEVEKAIHKASDGILYIRHETNKGGCAARNTGLSYAKGFYVAFLDDDDEWLPEKIAEQIKGFSDDDIALVYCGCTIIDQIRNVSYEQPNRYQRGYVFGSLLQYNFIGNTSNPLLKTECVVEVGCFDEKMMSSQDSDLWLRITKKYPANCIEKPLLNYYAHKDERISTNLDKKIAGQERLNEKYDDEISKDKETWYLRHIRLIPLYIRKGWKRKAFCTWWYCISKSPKSITRNIKLLFLVLFGFDSMMYRIYIKMSGYLCSVFRGQGISKCG